MDVDGTDYVITIMKMTALTELLLLLQ